MFIKFNLLFSKKGLITSTIVLTAVIAGSSTALAGITTPSAVFNNRLKTSGNYAWLGDSSTKYNCLAYALGVYNTPVWPWGSSNPTSAQMDAYLSSQGYTYSQPVSSSNVAVYELITYGTSDSNITHIARIAAAGYTNAKWGQLELLQHYGWDPYKSNTPPSDVYGDARRKYAVQ